LLFKSLLIFMVAYPLCERSPAALNYAPPE
jgi:hypothetical protein